MVQTLLSKIHHILMTSYYVLRCWHRFKLTLLEYFPGQFELMDVIESCVLIGYPKAAEQQTGHHIV